MRKLWNKEHSDSHRQFGVKANKDRQTRQVSKDSNCASEGRGSPQPEPQLGKQERSAARGDGEQVRAIVVQARKPRGPRSDWKRGGKRWARGNH